MAGNRWLFTHSPLRQSTTVYVSIFYPQWPSNAIFIEIGTSLTIVVKSLYGPQPLNVSRASIIQKLAALRQGISIRKELQLFNRVNIPIPVELAAAQY